MRPDPDDGLDPSREPAPSGSESTPVLPDVTADEIAQNWGEPAEDDDERLLREVPPHHLG